MKNKKVIAVICVIFIIIVGIVLFMFLNWDNKSADSNSENNIVEDISLVDISFNGLKIGDKLEENMKNLVLDTIDYKYEYNNIFINADSNDNVFYLGFFTSDSTYSISIADVNIEYDGYKLETISDFRDKLGNGIMEKSEYDSEDYYIKYYDDDLELSLFIRDNEVYNVVLTSIS